MAAVTLSIMKSLFTEPEQLAVLLATFTAT